MKKLILQLLFCVATSTCIWAQTISGEVRSATNEPLVGANVFWLNTNEGSFTDEHGAFVISQPTAWPSQLVATYIGYQSDTIELHASADNVQFRLQVTTALETVVVTEQELGTFISTTNTIKTESITEKELTRSACCDLAGCFNTQASVQPNTTNIVTDAKELRILGLSGVYNQILVDGLPLIQGASYTYGVSSIPGTLVKNIYVAKGANSVLQGFESISGQINVILKAPEQGDRLLLNAYANTFGERQYNINYSHRWNAWSTIASAHLTTPASIRDRDEDTFIDVPLLQRYAFFNKWKYRDANEWGKYAEISWRYVQEERQGGQTFYDADNDKGSILAYGQQVNFSQPEFMAKVGYRLDDYHHFSLQLSGFYHDQSSVFGTAFYDAIHTNAYANLQYELNWRTDHQLKTGFSYRLQEYQEDITFSAVDILNRNYDGRYLKQEYIPGWFVENVFHWLDDDLTLITGLRVDHHNTFGSRWTPRALLKAKLAPNTVARASIGKGWRTINLFAENVTVLASSRDIIIDNDIQPEEAWNYGINLTHNTYGQLIETQFSIDLYRTSFQNQIFPDYDTDPTSVRIANFTEASISNAAQVELGLAAYDRFGLKLAYNYLDVYRMEDERRQQLPFNSRHRFVTTFNYEPLSKAWHFDANLHWFGQQRLVNADDTSADRFSDPYSIFNFQFTKVWPRLEVYVGVENVFDFRQLRPIRSWQNPFDPLFDTANVWGPTQGRESHLGVRYSIE